MHIWDIVALLVDTSFIFCSEINFYYGSHFRELLLVNIINISLISSHSSSHNNHACTLIIILSIKGR